MTKHLLQRYAPESEDYDNVIIVK